MTTRVFGGGAQPVWILNPNELNGDVEFNTVIITVMKSGATQAGAGAVAGELWKTLGHATLPDNVVLHGV